MCREWSDEEDTWAKEDEVTGEWRRVYNGELQAMISAPHEILFGWSIQD
jgi:hypothetical protein